MPKTFNGSQLNFDTYLSLNSFTTISDKDGNLLLYTGGGEFNENGRFYYYPVWNKYHKMIENSSYENTQISKTASLLAPFPGKMNYYYIINGNLNMGHNTQAKSIVFDIIDLNYNYNQGKVISKENIINQGIDYSLFTLNLIKHSNRLSYWIITYGYLHEVVNGNKGAVIGSVYRNYLLSGNKAIDSSINYSKISNIIPNRLFISPNGKFISRIDIKPIGKDSTTFDEFVINSGYIEFSEFNSNNGSLNSKVIKLCDSCSIWSIEYSSDNRRLFTIEVEMYQAPPFRKLIYKIFQYTISTDPIVMLNSKKSVAPEIIDYVIFKNTFPLQNDPDGNQGGYQDLKLAPNNKIYISHQDTNFLSSLSYVNQNAQNVIFTKKSVDLENKKSILYFPVFLNDYYNVNVLAKSNTPICENEALALNADISDTTYPRSYEWKGPNGYTSTLKSPIINNIQSKNAGWYILKATVNGAELWDSVQVAVKPLAKPEISGTNKVFVAETKLYKTNQQANKSNQWSAVGGEIIGFNSLDSVIIKWGATGIGKVILEQTGSEFDCKGYNEFEVSIEEWPTPEINGKDIVCRGDTVKYSTFADTNLANKWTVNNGIIYSENNNETKIIWNNAGTGGIKILRNNKLTSKIDSSEITIIINELPPKPVITDKGNNNLETKESYLNQWYLNGEYIVGETKFYLKAKQSGIYQVIAVDTNGCKSELSDPFDFTVGVDDFSVVKLIIPNPATDYIEISGSSVILSEEKSRNGVETSVAHPVLIFDLLGIEITTPALRATPPYQGGEKVRIDVSGLLPGIYFVRVGDEVRKFVKF
jgi:hypothetical protein